MTITHLSALPPDWSDPFVPRPIAENLLSQPHHILLAYQHSYLLARMVPHTPADILTLYTPPEHRRQGAAQALMADIIHRTHAAGCPALTLEVRASNEVAIRLYEKTGFIRTGLRKGYYANPTEDGVVMEYNWALPNI